LSDNDNTYPNTGKISEYTTSGATVNANLVTGLNGADGITVAGSDLFVVNSYDGEISEFTTAGATVDRSFITGVGDPDDIVASGSDLYVMNYGTFSEPANGVGEFTTAGGTVNSNLIPFPTTDYLYRIAIGAPSGPAFEAKVAGTLPTTVKPGKKATIEPKITVTNISGAKYDATVTVHFYLSKSTSASGAILLPGKFTKSLKLTAGAHDSFSFSLGKLPSTVPAGTYHILAKITDANGDSVVTATKVTIRVT